MHSPNRSLHLLINERLNDEYSNQMVIIIMHYALIIMNYYLGGLAQLARAPALQAGGQRFESVILHVVFLFFSVHIRSMTYCTSNKQIKDRHQPW